MAQMQDDSNEAGPVAVVGGNIAGGRAFGQIRDRQRLEQQLARVDARAIGEQRRSIENMGQFVDDLAAPGEFALFVKATVKIDAGERVVPGQDETDAIQFFG